MNTCRSPEHPHCTVWVMPGETVCAHGHPQPGPPHPERPGLPPAELCLPEPPQAQRPVCPQPPRPHLRVSGFDPRAAGGRQAVKLELRGMPPDCPPRVTVLLKSALHLPGGERHTFIRTGRGDWRPVFIEFSSRGLEHGQYRIELELHARGPGGQGATRTWVCTLLILVPRADATLTDIHQAFLATHKNVRVLADDGSIARVNALAGGGRLDVDVSARNAAIAQLELDATRDGKAELALPTIAWDEDLVEIDALVQAEPHPYPVRAACIVNAGGPAALPEKVRLFAQREWVLGRFEPGDPQADVLLAHHELGGPAREGLTRRLSARHAVIRRGRGGFEIVDVSRFGLLADGAWPGRHVPVPLRAGMRIEFTASVRDVVTLVVAALLPNGVVLRRTDAGAARECFCLLEPDCEPGDAADAGALPLLFHRDGGFWVRDRSGSQDTALTPATPAGMLHGFGARARFAGGPYPETWNVRARIADRRRTRAGTLPPA